MFYDILINCEMFAFKYAEYPSRKAEFTFQADILPYFRKRMVYEIMAQKVIYP